MFSRDSDHLYRAPGLGSFPLLEHGFGTRLSPNWLDGRRTAHLKQVHSATAVIANGAGGLLGEGDALLTSQPGLLLAVRTADCLPIIVAGAESKTVAVIHAGWRGLVSGILPATIGKLKDSFSCRVENLHAAIGPGIRACCYEVGPEVASQFRPWYPERTDLNTPTSIDLAEAATRQLLKAGLPATQIEASDLCTRCRAEEFFSYRRQGEQAGRMWSAAGIRS